MKRRRGQNGFTLVELIVATIIMTLLTTMAVPLARYKVRRDKERDYIYAQRMIHKAIDDYKDAALAGKIATKLGTDGYPETLDDLVDGVNLVQSADPKKIKFLRKIPLDPFTNTRDWGKHSTQDDPTGTSWGGQNVFSVFTKSLERDANGVPYSQY
jgi:general secretion pathway protein G